MFIAALVAPVRRLADSARGPHLCKRLRLFSFARHRIFGLTLIGIVSGAISPLAGEMISAQPPEAPAASISPPSSAPASVSPPAPDRAAPANHVQELVDYLECLRKRKCSFSLTGEETAIQLGYSRLFASAYEEMILRIKALGRDHASIRAEDVIAQFESIVREEQAIDQLLERKERHSAAIAYLRAIQNGDVVFPAPQRLAPVPSALLTQLISAYPNVSLDINNPDFAAIYRKAREFASMRINELGEIRAHEIIAEFRRLVLESAATPAAAIPTACDSAAVVGALEVITRFCPRLRLSEATASASQEIVKQQAGNECRKKAAADVTNQIQLMQGNKIYEMCTLLEQQIQSGKILTLNITK